MSSLSVASTAQALPGSDRNTAGRQLRRRSLISRLSCVALEPPPNARPQLVDGIPVWPERWGITGDQLAQLLSDLRQHPRWDSSNSVYTLVNDFVNSWTRGTGMGYALTLNRDDPKLVTTMVSHAWAENAEEFLETLVRSAHSDEVFFICSLSLYQPEDSSGPSIQDQLGQEAWESPFHRVLTHIKACSKEAGWQRRCDWIPFALLYFTTMVLLAYVVWFGCFPGMHGIEKLEHASRAKWVLIFSLLFTLAMASVLVSRCVYLYPGRMVVVPNREVDIYSRLWCVYEIFVCKQYGIPINIAQTLSRAGKVRSRLATCGHAEDRDRIVDEIERHSTFEEVDKVVFITTNGAWWRMLLASVTVGSLIALFDTAQNSISPICSPQWAEHVLFHIVHLRSTSEAIFYGTTVFLSKVASWFSMFWLFARHQGTPSLRQVWRYTLGAVGLSLPFVLAGYLGTQLGALGSNSGACIQMMGTTLGLYHLLLASVATCAVYFPSGMRILGRLEVLMSLVICVVFPTLLCMQAARACNGSEAWDSLVVSSLLSTLGSYGSAAVVFWYAAQKWGMRVGTADAADQGNIDGSKAQPGPKSTSTIFPGSPEPSCVGAPPIGICEV